MALAYLLLFSIINLFAITKSSYEECGMLNEDLIYNKTHIAESDEFPWTALLGYRPAGDPTKLSYLCQGVLVSKRAVLTANHCLRQQNRQDLAVVALGYINQAEQQTCKNNPDCAGLPQIYDIEEIILNPNFNNRQRIGDIGMLRLEKDVTFSKYIQPICLPPADLTQNELVVKHMYVAGYPYAPRSPSDELSKTKSFAQIVSPEACHRAFDRIIELKNEHICGLVEDQLEFFSGAPLMDVRVESSKPKNFYLIGLLSAASRSGNEILPEVFANVATYLDWIKRNL